jgi:hypothetical protein
MGADGVAEIASAVNSYARFVERPIAELTRASIVGVTRKVRCTRTKL